MPTASDNDILAFLAELKYLISHNRFIICGARRKNQDTLLRLGITESQRNDYIANLTRSDYYRGPEPDDSGDGYVWIFQIQIDSHDIYIKLKIKIQPNGKIALCISFHIAEYPM